MTKTEDFNSLSSIFELKEVEMRKRRSKKDIQVEIDVIGAFSLGMFFTVLALWGFSYFGSDPIDIYELVLIIVIVFMIRSIYLKIKIKKMKK
jgi:O-antigen/teichoic acid export membrane protein